MALFYQYGYVVGKTLCSISLKRCIIKDKTLKQTETADGIAGVALNLGFRKTRKLLLKI